MSKILYLDFEFNRVVEKNVNLVSCATIDEEGNIKNFWLHNNATEQEELRTYLLKFEELVGYATVAEARSILALGLDPLNFKWQDLFIEYRLLSNSNDALGYGDQLVDGKVKYFKKPPNKWERTGKEPPGFKQTHSLAEATYKLLKVIRDTNEKSEVRDLIISDPKEFTDSEKQRILAYGEEDVKDIPRLHNEIKIRMYKNCEAKQILEVWDEYIDCARTRGRYSAHTAWMESIGYPIDYEKVKNFSSQIDNIVYELQNEINTSFPNIKPFRWNKKEQRFSFDQGTVKEWVKKNHDISKWEKTDSKDISLKLEAFTKFYDFKHDYPADNFGAQMVRYLKLKQTIYGFSSTRGKGKKSFWDSVGTDKRVRAYLNPFGAQTSRSQPGSTGFMFLKPAWMRALVMPEKGKAIGGIDYASEEFFIQALKSKDGNMIQAYVSGDVYMAFAIQAGLAPRDARKKTHKAIRDLCKSTVLGLGFNMTKYGLSIKLTSDSGKPVSEAEAEKFIDLFNSTYHKYQEYREEIQQTYKDLEALYLKDGWVLWGDNDNSRSVGNFPIQGAGATIMRKAVDKAVSSGLKVIFTLHDAIYIEYDVGDEYAMVHLDRCMKEAFIEEFQKDPNLSPREQENVLIGARKIRTDPFAWSPDYEADSEIKLHRQHYPEYILPVSNIYVDDRSTTDYEKFSKYFEPREESQL